jgi:hypothetical protein
VKKEVFYGIQDMTTMILLRLHERNDVESSIYFLFSKILPDGNNLYFLLFESIHHQFEKKENHTFKQHIIPINQTDTYAYRAVSRSPELPPLRLLIIEYSSRRSRRATKIDSCFLIIFDTHEWVFEDILIRFLSNKLPTIIFSFSHFEISQKLKTRIRNFQPLPIETKLFLLQLVWPSIDFEP